MAITHGILSQGAQLDIGFKHKSSITNSNFDKSNTSAYFKDYFDCYWVGMAQSTGAQDTNNVYDMAIGIYNLQEIPEIGNTASSEREKLDVTTLMDKKKAYIDGLEDSSEGGDALTFKFLYDPKLFNFLKEISTYYNDVGNASSLAEKKVYFRITFPSHNTQSGKAIAKGDICAKFAGEMSLSMDSVAVNSPMTFTMSVSLKSGIDFDSVYDDTNEAGYPLYW